MTLSDLRRVLRNSVLVPVSLLAMAAQPAWAAGTIYTVPPDITVGQALADTEALEVGAGGDVTKSAGGNAVTGTGTIHHVTVATTGTISGHNGSAIEISGNLTTFNNAGQISADAGVASSAALHVTGTIDSFTNTGTIATHIYDAVVLGTLNGAFLNDTGASITADTDSVVATQALGANATITNKGTIRNNSTDTTEASVVVHGVIKQFDNSGTIEAAGWGVIFYDGIGTGGATNSGTIKQRGNDTSRAAVNPQGVGGTFTNTFTGVIRGANGIVYATSATQATVVNAGTIVATVSGAKAIGLTQHDDSLTLETTSSITGLVDAGAGTQDNLILGGASGSASFAADQIGATKQYRNFENFSKTGGSKWTLTGTNTATATWDINAGTLAVNGAMANTFFNVNSGGTLQGTGTTGFVDVMDGGRIAPGNSVGTIHTGTITFENNSIYEVEVGAGVADKIVVTGDAFIGTGVTVHLIGSASFCGATNLDILTTTGTITGQSFTLDTLLTGVTLAQDTNSATLSFTGTGTGRTFTGFTNTPNQASTAAALDAMGCGNQPYATQLNALTNAQVPAAMDALSGEGHAAIAGALIESSQTISNTVDQRIQQAFDALDATGALSGYAAGPMLLGDLSGVTVWGSGYGGVLSRDGNGNAAATQSAASGLVFGADGKVSEDWRLGALGGLGLTGISSGATSGTSLDATIGGYAGAELGVVTVKLGAAYTRHFIDTSRSIVFPGVNDVVTASYQAGTAQAFLQFSHDFAVNGLTLTPYAKFQAVNHSTDAFTETGGAGKLSTAASVANALFVTLGVGAEDRFALTDTMLVTARGSVGWRHAFADALVATNSFAGGGPFSVSAAPIASDVAVISAGLVFDVSETLNVSLNYDGEIGSGLMSHSIRATAAGKF